MTLERKLSEHFQRRSGELTVPPDTLADVKRRGRRRQVAQVVVAGVSVVAVVVAGASVASTLSERRVDFAPAEQPSAAPTALPTVSEAASPAPAVTELATPASEQPEPAAPPTIAVGRLGAAVLRYDETQLSVQRPNGETDELWGGRRIDAVIPDGDGGAVVQSKRTLLWIQADGTEIRLLEAERPVALRAVLPDGRVLYSTRPTRDEYDDTAVEDYFAAYLTPEFRSENIATTGAYESGTTGPAQVADGGFVHGSCHLMCMVYEGVAEGAQDAKPLYDPYRSIGGMTSTAQGEVVAFVDVDIAPEPHTAPPRLVLLDGRTYEVRRRIKLDVPRPEYVRPVVSVTDGGQRILVGFASATTRWSPPEVTYLVEDALTSKPRITRVDGEGGVLWLDEVSTGVQ